MMRKSLHSLLAKVPALRASAGRRLDVAKSPVQEPADVETYA